MRILQVIPSISERSGGPGQAIIPMCRALEGQGVDVLLATTDSGIDGKGISTQTPTTYKGVKTIFFPAQWGESFKYSRPLGIWLDANIKSFSLVHIHAVFNYSSIAAARACTRHDVPYIVRPLGTLDPWSMRQKPLRKSLYWQLVGRGIVRDAAAVHYTSRAEQEATQQSLNLNHGRVVPLGIDAHIDGESFDSGTLPPEFSELATHPYVLVLSRLLPTKGLDVLLDAFLALVKQQEFANWRLVLAGEGPDGYVAELVKKAKNQNAERAVFFPGWVAGEQKNSLLRQASLLALPSYHENFGLCVMEALAWGVPALVSPHVHLAAEIQSAGAGWIAAVEKDAIENALKEALQSDIERAKRGQAGQELSREFTWPNIARQLIVTYSEVLAQQVITHA